MCVAFLKYLSVLIKKNWNGMLVFNLNVYLLNCFVFGLKKNFEVTGNILSR